MCRKYKVSYLIGWLMLAMPMMVSAECLTPFQATVEGGGGYSVTVQSDQGQGSIDCTAFSGDGGTMRQIPIEFISQDKTVGTANPYDPIRWEIIDPDPLVHADVVFIGNSDGSRCTQYYKGNTRAGYAAAGTKNNKDSTLVACTDDLTEPEQPDAPVAPVSTATSCIADPADQALQDAINDNGKYDVVIAIGRGKKGDNTAVCSDQPELGAMKTCVASCITPDPDSPIPWYDPDDVSQTPNDYDTYCTGDGPYFPIECRACELSVVVDSMPGVDGPYGSPQYCWEQLQKADLTYKGPDDSLVNGSFKKAPGPKSDQVWTVREYAGSTCYLLSGSTDSGYRYSYWVPSGCPK